MYLTTVLLVCTVCIEYYVPTTVTGFFKAPIVNRRSCVSLPDTLRSLDVQDVDWSDTTSEESSPPDLFDDEYNSNCRMDCDGWWENGVYFP